MIAKLQVAAVTLTSITALASGAATQSKVDITLLGMDGKPVSSENVGVAFVSDRRCNMREIRTTRSGRLRVTVPQRMTDDEVELRIQRVKRPRLLWFSSGQRDPIQYLGSYRQKLSSIRKLDAGAELKLQPTRVILSGKVVDGEGKPIPSVILRLPNNPEYSGSWSRSGDGAYFTPRLRVGKDGTFELREIGAKRDTLPITATAKGYKPTSKLEFKDGQKGVTIQLTKASTIHVTLLGVPNGKQAPGYVSADRVAPAPDPFGTIRAHSSRSGKFRLENCLPGRYVVHFTRNNEQQPCQTIENVIVKPGKDCRDHRLMAWDLSRYVRWIRVRVVDGAGKPLRGVQVTQHFKQRWGDSTTRHRTGFKGTVEIPVRDTGDKISIRHKSYGTQTFENVRRDLEVKLAASWQARVRITNLPPLQKVRLQIRMDSQPWQTLKKGKPSLDYRIATSGKHEFKFAAATKATGGGLFAARRFDRSDSIQFVTKRITVPEASDRETPIQLDVQLTKSQLEFLSSYDAFLREKAK